MPRAGGASSTSLRRWEPQRRGILDHPPSRMMTAAQVTHRMDKTTPHPLFKLATELGPLIVFCTLTLVLHDETFIKIKPTIIYGLFAAILGGGLLFGRSFIAIMFDQMFNLTPHGWRILTMRWALFFFAMAILNEIIWRTQSTDVWVAFKAFGVIPLTMGFAITQMPLVKRYHLEPVSLEASEAAEGDVSKG